MTTGPDIEFPDVPRSELEHAIEDLLDKAQRVLHTQGRLRRLLAATRSVGEGLDLPVVLNRIVEAATDLVGARYGALGVIGPDGALEEFFHVGIDDETAARIGEPPRGRGILGAVVEGAEPVRLDRIGDDPRAYGFPAHHPPMEGFLGVPIAIRGEVYGSLYLADREDGPFSVEDEELLTALAASAAAAIDNARLFGQAERRRRWAVASAETAAAVLDADTADPLTVVTETLLHLADAAVVALLTAAPVGGVRVDSAWGEAAATLEGRLLAAGTTVAEEVIAAGDARVSGSGPVASLGPGTGLGPFLTVPISLPGGGRAALAVARSAGGRQFTDVDLDMAMEFASHAGVALQLHDARRVRERLTLLEDRERIARDLHDNVIQRLFGAGMTLNALDPGSVPPEVSGKIDTVTRLLDEAIAEIRASVFALREVPAERPSLRQRLLDVAGDVAAAFPTPARVLFEGDVDEAIPVAVLPDIEAVVREGLSNAARHAAASEVAVTVVADDEGIRVSVADDGTGVAAPKRSSGLANLSARAAAWSGTSSLLPREGGGAVLDWRIPAPPRDKDDA
ncbi:GAF domain-containing sensor histidine kinase [Microbacterium betulae]|uniref:GAF domain-containing sensor histidine kinase n=1 Tax=Microbacterium betulae TaxID=2981139 RepID=A0AA97I4F2_9MICO|nr:GAF domain-containing sensor histidine kinase [Microbacterium sp. AB]WOF22546.1 GAF domain-containing sensor histidine kinase [Microbacterium sp. AB]